MKKLTNLMLFWGVLLGLSTVVGLNVQRVSAHEGEDHSSEGTAQAQQKEDQKKDKETKPAVKYSYVAQPGDSYTLLARKAVQTYGKKHNVKLSSADIIFAETNLTQAAGSPQLEIGQQVEITEATVKNWVDQAGKLSAEAEAGWNYYVQFVDSFNTDSVGQAS